MAVQERLMTAEEFGQLPDDGRRHELVRGIVVEVSRPKPLHGKIQRRIGAKLGDFVDANDLGEVFTESGFILARKPDIVRGPDVAFVSKARLPEPDLHEYIPGGPDLAVEIVSPGDTAQEVLDKIDEYFQANTQVVWVVYPDKQKVYVYTDPKTVQILGAEDMLSYDMLPGFSLPLSEVFEGL